MALGNKSGHNKYMLKQKVAEMIDRDVQQMKKSKIAKNESQGFQRLYE